MKKSKKLFTVITLIVLLVVLSCVVIGFKNLTGQNELYGNWYFSTIDDTNKAKATLNANYQLKYDKWDIMNCKNIYCVSHWMTLDDFTDVDDVLTYQATMMADITGETAKIYKYDDTTNSFVYLKTTTNEMNNVMAGIVSDPNAGDAIDYVTTEAYKSDVPDGEQIYKGHGAAILTDMTYSYIDENGKFIFVDKDKVITPSVYTYGVQIPIAWDTDGYVTAYQKDDDGNTIYVAKNKNNKTVYVAIDKEDGNALSVVNKDGSFSYKVDNETVQKEFKFEVAVDKNGNPKSSKQNTGEGEHSEYTISQVATWLYWNYWAESTGEYGKEWNNNASGFMQGWYNAGAGWGNDALTGGDVGGKWVREAADNYLAKLKTIAKNKEIEYSAKIYFVKYDYGINTTTGKATNAVVKQNLIVTEPRINIPVEKVWEDGNNVDKDRLTSITVGLYANYTDGTSKKVGTTTLDDNNSWKYTFEDYPQLDDDGNYITYTVKEETDVSKLGYTVTITGNAIDGYGFTITNTKTTNVKIVKTWDDQNDLDGYRPTEITVKLLADGSAAKDINGDDASTVKITNSSVSSTNSNVWEYVVTNLPRYNGTKEITYTLEEVKVDYYEAGTVQSTSTIDSSGVKIFTLSLTNKHTPNYEGYIEITGKVWLDIPDGKATVINGTLDDDEKGIAGVTVKLKDENGNDFDATSSATTNSDGTYTIKVNYDNTQNVYKLYEDSTTVKEKLKKAYVVFEYDGLTYTTVATAATGANTSRAVENETERNTFDSKYSNITSSTSTPENWNKTITASTQNVISFETYTDSTTKPSEEVLKYCNGDGTYSQTNPGNAWDSIKTGTYNCSDANCTSEGHKLKTYQVEVQEIQNVNLGLFKREQPDVAITSDISKVEVTMNNQAYTYLYGIKSDKYDDSDLKAKFQNKDTYTYRRPVNPADIAYINETVNNNKELMEVYVTYKITIGNESSTLPITVDSIINSFDNNYQIQSIVKGTMTDTTKGTISGTTIAYDSSKETTITNASGMKHKQYILDLGQNAITVQPLSSSTEQIFIRYKVSNYDTIKGILNDEPTLNNAVEINSYSTTYGSKTLYAEQRTHEVDVQNGLNGRGGTPYGGYDNDSHPGNAGIELVKDTDGVYRLKPTENLVEYVSSDGTTKMGPEDDTDIAPSFVLCKDEKGSKTLAGTIWEDTDANNSDDERLGDGHYDSSTEKTVQYVKVELYNIDGTLTKLYQKDDNGDYVAVDAVVYTDANGNYALDGVVTGEYFMKFTYGNDTTDTSILKNATTIDGGTTTINARNYKSTIITDSKIADILEKDYSNFTDEEKMWHITHSDNYSVAVDNMLDRLKIEDLTYYNFDTGVNMTAFTKPFITQLEFEANGQSGVDGNGNIPDVTNKLDKLDFGIAERPREDIYVQKTVEDFKITLSSGQILAQGNPNAQDANIAYTKIMGFNQEIKSGKDARNAYDKRLLVEIDSQLIQGAQLEVKYSVKVTNNNEKDYDYGAEADYTDIVAGSTTGEYDKYITKSEKAKYYYYGDSTGLSEMKATVEFVDYMTGDIVYSEDATKWTIIDAEDLYNSNLISEDAKTAAKSNKYTVLQSATGASITLERNTSFEQDMLASKVLANDDENTFDNNAEIIKIDGKTARTIQESQDGKQITKSYIPGNYEPSSQSNTKEQDDDRVEIIITPGTGTTNYVMPYIIAGLIGLIVMIVGVVFIKKKVLKK